jgi:hypothetical protein
MTSRSTAPPPACSRRSGKHLVVQLFLSRFDGRRSTRYGSQNLHRLHGSRSPAPRSNVTPPLGTADAIAPRLRSPGPPVGSSPSPCVVAQQPRVPLGKLLRFEPLLTAKLIRSVRCRSARPTPHRILNPAEALETLRSRWIDSNSSTSTRSGKPVVKRLTTNRYLQTFMWLKSEAHNRPG